MHLIFDLDGTIVDSYIGIEAAFNFTIVELNASVKPSFVLKNHIGKPLFEIFLAATENNILSEQAIPIFRKIYGEKHFSTFSVYHQAQQTLLKLYEQGHTLHLVSNKALTFSNQILSEAGLRHLFKGVYGPAINESLKKIDLIQKLLLQYPNIHAGNSIMIGDTRNDFEAVQTFKIPVIILLHGYGKKSDFEEKEILGFCQNFNELSHSINKHHAGI